MCFPPISEIRTDAFSASDPDADPCGHCGALGPRGCLALKADLATCDDCGESIPGLSAYEAGFGTLALCATCNHGTAVCGGNGVAWSSAPEEEADAYNVPPVLDHGGDTAESVAAEMAARSVECAECGHEAHPGEAFCPHWFPEENMPCCGCQKDSPSERVISPQRRAAAYDAAAQASEDRESAAIAAAEMAAEARMDAGPEDEDFAAMPEPCAKCLGSGIYRWGGSVVNGVWVGKSGVCFGCRGKGFQDEADERRNDIYWNEFALIRVQ